MLAAVRSLTIPVISAFIPLVALADVNYCNSRDDLVWDAGTQTCENKLSIFTGELRVLTDPIVAKPAATIWMSDKPDTKSHRTSSVFIPTLLHLAQVPPHTDVFTQRQSIRSRSG